MKKSLDRMVRQLLPVLLVAGLFTAAAARAGLSLEMNVIRYHQYGYYFYPGLTTNTAPDNITFGDYFIASCGYPTNGSSALYHFSTNGFNQVGGGSYGYGDFDGMMHELTNGNWSICMTNSVMTNVYYFTVTANLISNDLPYVPITFPADGAVNVTNQPTFIWQGPTNYSDLVVYEYNHSEFLPVGQTSWVSPRVLYRGINSFTAHYDSNSTVAVVSSIPTNGSGSIANWVSTAHLQDYSSSQFTVGTVDTSGTSHMLVARYAWDDTNADGTASGADSSGNGYDMNFGGSFGGQGGVEPTTDRVAGPRAILFHDGDGNSAGYVGWNPTPTNLLGALAGSFSISCWIKTTQNNFGWDTAPAYYGAGIVCADNGGLANDLVPIALTGNTIGFNTGGSDEDVTLNSVATVNDGTYHHVVVTRNQATGQKVIYIDGVLDGFSSGSTNRLSDPQLLSIGALADASDADASSAYYYQGYDGALDDLQIYSGVLSASEVAALYAQSGTTVANGGGSSSAHQIAAHYSFDNASTIFSLGLDSSPAGNSMSGYGYWGMVHTNSADAVAGGGAAQFFGTSSINCYDQVLTNLNEVLAGNFTFSTWVKTTTSKGNDYDNAYFGATIFWAYNDHGNTNDTIPLAITGSKAAFTTRDHLGNFSTLHSATSVNDGNYHLITVTRDQGTGEKKMYVDGSFESSEFGTTDPLNGNDYNLTIGGTTGSSYAGLLDDLQIYTGVLSDSDIATLYANPGTNIADIIISHGDFPTALNTTNLAWVSGGDMPWITETNITHDGIAAASGQISDSQASHIETVVPAKGQVSFYWKVSSEDGFDYLIFYINGNEQDSISGEVDWNQETYAVAAGDVLRWEYSKDDSDSAGEDTGYLDQINYLIAPPDTNVAPVITINPFSQTNYPGYTVALFAAATSNPTATWQWFKAGTGLITNATAALFIPTNSGTAGVAGSYYAVATNIAGSATTLTAVVTFASAPLPPDWSLAFKSPLYNDSSDITTNYNIACLLDATGTNLYTVGFLQGTNTFGLDTLISANGRSGSMFLKQTTVGTPVWGRAITNNGFGSSYAQCVAPAPGNGIYVSGVINGTNWLGTNRLVDIAGGATYLTRFDANGSNLWVRLITGTNDNFTTYHQLVSDPDGNVTLSALIWGGTSFGTTNLFADGQRGVLVQYDADGNVRWVQSPSSWPDYLTYSAGRIYGSMGGGSTCYIGGITNVSDRRRALFALNATNGQGFWIRGVAAQQDQGPPVFGNDNVLVAVSGTNVFIAGNAWGSNAVFGPFTVNFPVSEGQYLARFDTDGNAQLATTFGSPYTWLWTIKADASGNIYVGGDFDTYSVFGSSIIAAPFYETIQSVGGIENRIPGQTFVAKFDCDGNPLWARPAHSDSSYLNGRDLALAPDGVWSCGFFNPIGAFGTNTVYGGITIFGSPFGTIEYHSSGYVAKITDGVAVGLPVTLLNPQNNGTNFQFQFLSQSGFTHAIQYKTNLIVGNWLTYSNVTGDGALKSIPVPLSIFNPMQQGFVRVSTQ